MCKYYNKELKNKLLLLVFITKNFLHPNKKTKTKISQIKINKKKFQLILRIYQFQTIQN